MIKRGDVKTILDCLNMWSGCRSSRSAFIFLDSNGEQIADVTFSQLKQRSLAVAHELLKIAVPGERAVLFFQSGLEFIYAFLGCLYAGVVAVPIPPPQGKRQISRVNSILEDADSSVILSTKAIRLNVSKIEQREPLLSKRLWIEVEGLSVNHSVDLVMPEENQLAFLQYTSGSTSLPKGVMISHRQLVYNECAIAEAFEHHDESKVVGWLPFYHDMGLIGNVLHPIFLGITSVLMAPATFLQNPFLWLKAISDYKSTTSGGPDFAYRFCVQSINAEMVQKLDLSNWKIAFNGSEVVRKDTLEIFSNHFYPSGFAAEAFYPCYGLAESTLFAAGINAGKPHRVVNHQDCGKILPLVSCGYPPQDHLIKIVDPVSKEETETGEIWLSGPSIAEGYWNQPEKTQEIFNAYTAQGIGPFMRTGDLGFIDEGELFIAGRVKNLMIIRGRNYYPDDIEAALQNCHTALQDRTGAAFSIVHENEEKLIVLFELDRIKMKQYSSHEIIKSMRRTLSEEFFLDAHALVLVKPGGIPRTTSGKVQYYLCREKYIENSLSIDSSWQDQGNCEKHISFDDHIEESIKAYCASLLKVELTEISLKEPLLSYGMDSLKAMRLMDWLKKQWGIQICIEDLFGEICIQDIAALQRNSGKELFNREDAGLFEGAYPLSSNQRNLLTSYLIDPADVSYHIPAALKFSGLLDINRFKEALQSVALAHPQLRTIFENHPAGPRQRVLTTESLSISVVERTPSLDVLIREEAYRPFDIFREALFRTLIVKMSRDETIVLFTFHHLICDGWSMNLFLDYLKSAYLGDQRPGKSESYRSFVLFQKQKEGSSAYLKQQQFWEGYLGNDFPTLTLGPYHQCLKSKSSRGALEFAEISKELSKKLANFNRQHQSTLSMSLMTLFHALLHLYSGQKAVFVGYPSANRSSSGMTNTFGYFVNTLVSRTSFAGKESFIDLLKQIKRGVVEGINHEAFPFQDILKTVNPPRIEGISPIFQAMFVMQNAPHSIEGFAGLTVEILPQIDIPVIYDIVLEAAETEEAIKLKFEYRVDALPAFLVRQFSKHYLELLEYVLDQSESKLSMLPLTIHSKKNELRLFSKLTEPLTSHGDSLSILDLFEKQVEAKSSKIAVESDAGRLTYQQLHRKSNGIAQFLLEQGLKPQEPVGICMDRSPGHIAALLGIAKAGGAYVPIDRSYPIDRINFMVEDAGIRFLLIEKGSELLHQSFNAQLFIVDGIESIDHFSRQPLAKNHLAYILYTSGSTGRPKGVMVEHGPLSNFTMEAIKLFEITDQDRVLQFSSMSWDTSSEEIYPCLACGGTLVLRGNDPVETFESLIRRTHRNRITVWNLPTSYWGELSQELISRKASLPESLRLVIVGGEKISRDKVENWNQCFGSGVKLLNTYGATEATSISLAFDLSDWKEEYPHAPIGFPLGNMGAQILNEELEEVPVAVAGSLYLSGAGLARAYLNLPELTDQKFVQHPKSGERLYHTGDAAYRAPDGTVLYLGRLDDMIKRRGFRIELGEIEAVLGKLPSVSKCLVLEKTVDSKSSELIAYVSVRNKSLLDVRRELKERLPGYMVPDQFVSINDFPRLPNGKIDRQALLRIKEEAIVYQEEISKLEASVIAIWCDLLQISSLSKNSAFFDAGGDSLLIIKLHQRLCEAFSLNFDISNLFKYATCESQAQFIETLINKKHQPEMTSLELLKKLEEGCIDLELVKQQLTILQK